MEQKYDIFISYSRKNKETVLEIKDRIERETNASCWMDLDGIESGEEFGDRIIAAINMCDTMLFMRSKESMESEYALKELDFAKYKSKRIVIVAVDRTGMIDKFYFHYKDFDQISWKDSLQQEKLMRDLKKWFGSPNSISSRKALEDLPLHKRLIYGLSSLLTRKERLQQLRVVYDELESTTSQKEMMESEIRIARDNQMSILPMSFPEHEYLDMYGFLRFARVLGGDFFDYALHGDTLKFCIGDVSGKGAPASLFMTQVVRLFKVLAKQEIPPSDIAKLLNKEMCEGNEQGMFATMFIGQLNLKTGHLDFCNAGHNSPILVDEGKAEFTEMLGNAPIALWQGMEYEGESLELTDGQMLFLYTDGVNETENKENETFGDDKLLETLASAPAGKTEEILNYVSDVVENYRNDAEQNDDLAMLGIKLNLKDSCDIISIQQK